MSHLIPIPFLVLTCGLLIRAEMRSNSRQVYLWKPLSTLLVILVCALSFGRPDVSGTFTWLILLGLVLSMGGDIALMFRSDSAFLAGVGSFALAQLTYGLTFRLFGGFYAREIPVAVVLLLIGVGFFIYVHSHLGPMRIPIMIYALLISFMVCSAAATLFDSGFSVIQGILLTVGASLFYTSDIILAVNKFRHPFRMSRLANLSTYYAGQLLIALAASYG